MESFQEAENVGQFATIHALEIIEATRRTVHASDGPVCPGRTSGVTWRLAGLQCRDQTGRPHVRSRHKKTPTLITRIGARMRNAPSTENGASGTGERAQVGASDRQASPLSGGDRRLWDMYIRRQREVQGARTGGAAGVSLGGRRERAAPGGSYITIGRITWGRPPAPGDGNLIAWSTPPHKVPQATIGGPTSARTQSRAASQRDMPHPCSTSPSRPSGR